MRRRHHSRRSMRRATRLSEYRGEVVMLSFWATWCGDCRAQLEELGAMHDRYQDAGIELLAVSLDQNARQASEVTAGVSFPVLHDPAGDVGRLYDVDRMPVMVLSAPYSASLCGVPARIASKSASCSA